MKDYASLTDEQLALLYVGGDFRAFDLLLERNQQKLYSYILFVVHDPEVANDIFSGDLRESHHQVTGRQVYRFRQIQLLAVAHCP